MFENLYTALINRPIWLCEGGFRLLRSVYTERDRGLTAFVKEWSK